ncbi:DHHC zinc finger protein (macronuclear) [Tetrahymena thermophila SB210]|uniref:Palmitoyltransferase n=1 Tax=Tetrahymena thermophila (strain SB210) TaxID=312017 RepID=Q23DT9_TETTS|nr:DHHC zinc finger protein [Tetrahymena thermophila SB210]EAR94605.2 DHHC zinc finger protein [Tetrahymena thermophila SB210]|eukprot:XP_001014597.2 DHHC zinc finger protein [Tetrahymena thermophila SB210]
MMLKFFIQGLWGERKAFFFYDLFECTLCMGFLRMVPLFNPIYSAFKSFRSQITDPIDSLIMQCQSFLKCLPRPISQLAGYPIAFCLLLTYLVNGFREFAIIKEDTEDFLFYHLVLAGFVASAYILTYFISPGYFDRPEDKEEFQRAIQTKAELKNNDKIFCMPCQTPKVARSFHCQICHKCTAKTEYHSTVFNKCIGAGNHPYYYLFILGMSILFGLQFIFLSSNRTLQGKKVSVIPLLLNLRIFVYYALLTGQHTVNIISNLSYKEIGDARRLPYLWKNLQGEYFNPFDKGVCGNLREFILVISTNKSIPLSQQELKQYQQVSEEEKSVIINKQDQTNYDSDDDQEEEKKNDNEERDEFEDIGKDKPIPEKYINWRTKKFYTVVDIPNSPLREMAIAEMKKKFRLAKKRSLGDNQFQAQQMLRMNEQRMMRGEITQEELERQKNEIVQKLKKEREEYMLKQMVIQKKEFEKNPQMASQAKLQMEMGMTNARLAMINNPQRAEDIKADLQLAEKNYVYLFGQEALDQFTTSLVDADKNQQYIQQQYVNQQQQQQQQQNQVQQQEVKQVPKHIYQPEQTNLMQPNFNINH